jgi:hypothetical protein
MPWLELYAQLKVYEWLIGAVCGGFLLLIWLVYLLYMLAKDIIIPLVKETFRSHRK